MPSLQSRLLYLAMRYRHVLRFRLTREAWDWNTSIPDFRRECEEANSRLAQMPAGIEVIPVEIEALPAGLSAEWILPVGAMTDKVILYTHGGGYVSGSCTDHRAMVAKLVKGSGIAALLFDYRLAPEHPFPAALDDTLAVYRWLLDQDVPPEHIVIVGESAGGGLCLATLLALRDQAMPLPRAAVAMSPYTDLKLTGESHQTKARVCLSPPGMAVVCSKYYAGDNDPGLPYISPLYGDLHGLPPLLIYVGDYETLLDDSTRFAAKAEAAGVEVTLRVGEGMVHCYPLLAPLFPEATQALAEICAFINAQLAQAAEPVPAVAAVGESGQAVF
jgi:monoterpene epsilon-lactone hydrolase